MTKVPDRKPIIELYTTCGTSLIIAFPTGITYTNQAGGLSCLQPGLEGALVPFENDYDEHGRFLSLDVALREYFSQHGTPGALTEKDADFVDGLLRDFIGDWIAVDRGSLNLSCEAWVYVTVLQQNACYFHGFEPYPRKGVLTWANSD